MESKMLSQIHSDHLWYVNLCDQGMPRLNIITGQAVRVFPDETVIGINDSVK